MGYRTGSRYENGVGIALGEAVIVGKKPWEENLDNLRLSDKVLCHFGDWTSPHIAIVPLSKTTLLL